MTLQALLFDVDGTLADTERDGHRVAFNRAFAAASLDWRWDVALYGELLTITGGKERMRHYVEQYRPDWPKPENPATAPGVALPPPSLESFSELITRLHAAKTAHYTALLAQGAIPLRPGVRQLLAKARAAKLRLAIATTTTPANVSALLRHTLGSGAESWFEVIGAGDVVPAKKPAPDIYYHVLERLGLPAANCLAFEDSENGICVARAAGLKTVVTVNDYTRLHDFTGAAVVLDHLGEADRPFKVLSRTPVNGFSFANLDFLLRLHAAA